ncbi:MAG: guanylate kinase [Alphaproteobacteria bacterium]|nr:guanylate kinase [Alphaproteobacteria bacterium]
MREIKRRGVMFVVSSPSGAGKTSIVKQLLSLDQDLVCSVSITTRPKRPGEVDGKDYYFVSTETFHELLANGELLEHAYVYDHYYGTPKSFVLQALSDGKDVIFDIDWQGTQQLAQLGRSDLIGVFILPPSVEELEKRLRKRGSDSEDVLSKRMQSASADISHWAEYDYVIINRQFDKSVQRIYSILISERLKRKRLLGLVDFVNELRQHPK